MDFNEYFSRLKLQINFTDLNIWEIITTLYYYERLNTKIF